jgi:hypothetical protein
MEDARASDRRRLVLTIRLKCSKKGHSKYNPARDGEAGVKGGCNFCLMMLHVHRAVESLRREADRKERA